MKARIGLLLVGLAVIAALWSLRDPAWLGGYTRGLFPPGVDESGRTTRWTGGRASFYVPASASRVSIDLAGELETGVIVSIYVDGQRAARVQVFRAWQNVTVTASSMRATSRRHRRVDIQVSRTWAYEKFGVRIGWPVTVE